VDEARGLGETQLDGSLLDRHTRVREEDRRRTSVKITPAGRRALTAARREERESDTLLGAVDDYEHFRQQLIALIATATTTTG
jgi:DNA-binding MarR family transcriptional regulator